MKGKLCETFVLQAGVVCHKGKPPTPTLFSFFFNRGSTSITKIIMILIIITITDFTKARYPGVDTGLSVPI